MGYHTDFMGELKFTNDITAKQLAKLKTFFGADQREHPEWNAPDDFYYIDLELTDDFSGIKWSGGEKTYGLWAQVNTIIEQMQKEYPDFGLEGELLAQGEDMTDRWKLVVENNKAKVVDIVIKGKKIKCPECGCHFILEEETDE